MKTLQVVALDNVACDVSQSSQPIDLNGIYGFFAQWLITGTVTGNMIMQGSVDGVTYHDISTTSISGTKGYVNLDAQYYRWLIVKFSRSSGTASDKITAQVFLKGI
jgi:hypothetical protein